MDVNAIIKMANQMIDGITDHQVSQTSENTKEEIMQIRFKAMETVSSIIRGELIANGLLLANVINNEGDTPTKDINAELIAKLTREKAYDPLDSDYLEPEKFDIF